MLQQTRAELENVHSVLPFKMTVRAELHTSESESRSFAFKKWQQQCLQVLIRNKANIGMWHRWDPFCVIWHFAGTNKVALHLFEQCTVYNQRLSHPRQAFKKRKVMSETTPPTNKNMNWHQFLHLFCIIWLRAHLPAFATDVCTSLTHGCLTLLMSTPTASAPPQSQS